MTASLIISIIGWVFLIASWIIPFAFKTKQNARFIAAVLSAVSLGMFLSNLIISLMK